MTAPEQTTIPGVLGFSPWYSSYVAAFADGPVLYGNEKRRLALKKSNNADCEIVPTLIDGDADYTIKMATSTGATGKAINIFGQNTQVGFTGGQVRIASGSGTDSNGVVIAERTTGSETASSDIVQFFAQGGTVGQLTMCGGSSGVFQQLGPGLSVVRIGSTTAEMILDAGTDLFIRVSNQANTVFRAGPGQTLAFHGTAPQAKQSISGSRGGNAALADLLTKLAAIGLITDGTSA